MLRIAITGSSGLIGTAVAGYFQRQGHVVTPLVRSKSMAGENAVYWDIPSRQIEADKLEGHDVVIHLAGANIAARRWSPQFKEEILFSRVQGTELLCRTLSRLKIPPNTLFSASAIGIYGNNAPHISIDEEYNVGNGFLADVCVQWEKAAEPAESSGIRVVFMRFGVVLSPKGGALAKMLPAFKLGLGGRLGTGTQMMSWIALDEIPPAIEHLISATKTAGPVNFVSPQPVSNTEFTKILAKVIRRPAVFPVPAFGVRLLFGEMGQTLLLEGARVIPRRLQESGYAFRYPDLEAALRL